MRFLIQVLFLLAVVFAPIAAAQDTQSPVTIDKRKLLVQPRNQPAITFFEDPVLWMSEKQRSFYGSMSKSLRQIKAGSASNAAWTLLLVSFLYGVFHAAGPGHGKAVVSAWILANKSDLRRGMTVAFLSAMVQALTAILIVSGLMIFFSNATALARQSAGLLDSASFAMISVVGLYMMWTSWRGGQTSHHHDHQHHGIHQHDASCGHAHAPTPSQVRGETTFLQMLTLAIAVGIRPCTGAILVLVFAWSAGIYWAGVLSALVMGLGVFLTIGMIATLSVYAKALALKMAGTDNIHMALIARLLKFGGGMIIAGFGLLLFMGSMGNTAGFL